jgi:hypothetical protein
MAGIQRTLAELQDQLEDQLYFLEASALAYDRGQDREAKRLATALRVLVHDKGSRSRSILTQLNMKSQPFYDSAPDYNAYNWAAHAGLTCVALDPHGSSTKILPCLDRIAEKPAWVSFDAWWGKIVVVALKRHEFRRRDLVLTLADTDGGAHVDPDIPEKYYLLTRGNSLGWTNGHNGPVLGIALASVRQIAHEVLKTLRPGYTAAWPEPKDDKRRAIISGVEFLPQRPASRGTPPPSP